MADDWDACKMLLKADVDGAFAVIRHNIFGGKREWLVFSATSQTTDTDVAVKGLTQIAKAAAARM